MTKIDNEPFFVNLDSLDTGERAALRREAGRLIRQAQGTAVTTFYKCLPLEISNQLNRDRDRQEDCYFAVACLRCLWDAGEEKGEPLERIISNLCSGALSDSTKHRIEVLLDTDWDSDGYMLVKLSRLVKLIRQKSDRAMIDFSALLDDLLIWNSPYQSVQRKWARTIFTINQNTKTEE